MQKIIVANQKIQVKRYDTHCSKGLSNSNVRKKEKDFQSLGNNNNNNKETNLRAM